MGDAWSLQVDDGLAVINFDDGKANAYTTDGLERLNELLDVAQEQAFAIIMYGRPGYFSGGFDLQTIRQRGGELDQLLATGARTFARLLVYPRPVIAACSGHALAAAALVLLASDIRIGVEGDFKIGLNEVAIGSPLPRFLVELARYRMPAGAADEILWGATHPPDRAVERGYLDRVVPGEALERTCEEEARRLMRLRRGVVASAKRSLRGEVAARMLSDLDGDLALLNPRRAVHR